MSAIPAFEIGVWNAWILLLFLPLHPLIMMLIDKLVGTGDIFKKMDDTSAFNKTENIMNIFGTVLFFGLFAYSIFLPLQLGTTWFYVGLALCVLGVVTWTISIVNIADIPLGEPWNKGLYRYSRNPMYFASFLILIGAGIASASWVFLLLSIVYIILTAIFVSAEERFCLDKFGTPYREYIGRTPRWIGLPKS
ncbi:MAG TPA: isoprenylcysteine carboxylmethyltransferase family protein [Dehalococcoidia bacterium]|nr:isoprenylcysteine carboxylmethyltransferase family protein [Dehalococcoidia bacterium]